MTPDIKKGDIVRLHPYWSNALKVVPHRQRQLGWRPIVSSELEEWNESMRQTGDYFDSAGEPRLPPQYATVETPPEGVWIVQRARVSAPKGYRKVPGCALLLDTKRGISFYIRREMLVLA
jgi:hypothetical protein